MSSHLGNALVVGASLAGLRAAEVLRSEGFEGPLTVVGDEPHAPYDRPPLSKAVLTDTEIPAVTLRAASADLDIHWELGCRATALDVAARAVSLDDGRRLDFDGLVIATGARARVLAGTEAMERVFTLRTLDDALAVRAAIDAGARSVLVVGAGFIGSEVAASCRERGLDVILVEPLKQPLARVLGEEVGSVLARLHREHGVDLRLGVGVDSVAAVPGSPGVRVTLSNGDVEQVDFVVVGLGVIPNTEWLESSGIEIDNGVVCDQTTLVAPGIVAAGDVARWPHRLFNETMRVEHWEHALDMGGHAARRLLAGDGPGEVYQPVPWFWSDQYDRKLQVAGRVRPTDEMQVVDGALDDSRFCVLYGRDGAVTGVVAMNMPAKVVRYRRAIAEGLEW